MKAIESDKATEDVKTGFLIRVVCSFILGEVGFGGLTRLLLHILLATYSQEVTHVNLTGYHLIKYPLEYLSLDGWALLQDRILQRESVDIRQLQQPPIGDL